MEAKRIKFERTGGFAGIRFAADFKLSELPEDQAHQILELLDAASFNELPGQMPGNPQVADGFSYSITVVTEKQEQTVTTSDTSTPQNMEPLLELLTTITRQQMINKK